MREPLLNAICVIVSVTLCFGCATAPEPVTEVTQITTPQAVSGAQYVEVNLAQLGNQAFYDDFKDKRVVFDADSIHLSPSGGGGKYAKGWIQAIAYGGGGARGIIELEIPKEKSDIVFSLDPSQSVRVYGKAVPDLTRATLGMRRLLIEVDKIEVSESVTDSSADRNSVNMLIEFTRQAMSEDLDADTRQSLIGELNKVTPQDEFQKRDIEELTHLLKKEQ